MKILFMGTPDFSVPCLQALCDANHSVCGVVTQPDKPVGRKQVLTPPPVKVEALSRNIPVFQPETLKNQAFASALEELQPEVVVVVAYGKLLPSYFLEFPKYGCINVHASLLPKYRGAGPIQRSIIEGERYTGVTTMFMARGMDTGDMLLSAKEEILDTDDAGTMHEKLSHLGADLLLQTLQLLEKGGLKRIPQEEEQATYAPMLEKGDGHLDIHQPMEALFNRARGVSPWPGAFVHREGKLLKLFGFQKGRESHLPAGTLIQREKLLAIVCGDGRELLVEEVQPEGSKRMPAASYFLGHPAYATTTVS